MRPVIFLAFANDPEAPLNGLSKEREDIREALHEAEKVGLCEVIEHVNVTLDDIIGVFRIKITEVGLPFSIMEDMPMATNYC
jgi:hypothetical protein